MSDIPDKIIIGDDGKIQPEASASDENGRAMLIEINGKKESVSFDQALSLAISILYQVRLYNEHNRS